MEERTLMVRRQGRHLLRYLKLCVAVFTGFAGFNLLTLGAAMPTIALTTVLSRMIHKLLSKTARKNHLSN